MRRPGKKQATTPKAGPPIHVKLTPEETHRRRDCVVALVKELPEAMVTQHGRHLSLEIRGRRFGWYLEDHHGDGRLALNCRAPAGANETLARESPDKFHVPKYLGHRGWVGLWLDSPKVDWPEVKSLLTAAYRLTAPKSLSSRLSGEAVQ